MRGPLGYRSALGGLLVAAVAAGEAERSAGVEGDPLMLKLWSIERGRWGGWEGERWLSGPVGGRATVVGHGLGATTFLLRRC